MFNLSDDDSFSTQLEGKKLKNRGARFGGSFIATNKSQGASMGDPELDISEDGPALLEDNGVEDGQEYFTDRELGKENKEEREERLKRELAAARKQQLDLQKTQQQHLKVEQRIDDPNLKLDEIEQGVMQSQNKGHKTVETEFKQHGQAKIEAERSKEGAKETGLRKTDTAATNALLGPENAKNLDLTDDKKLAKQNESKSIPAQMLPDVRGGQGAGLGM